jgi:tRNA pseudouridine55 synthase
MDGIFNIDKPQGMTSHDVVARVKRLAGSVAHRETPEPGPDRATGKKPHIHVGHAGTLDPLATGVLPVVLGKATRLVEYLAGADKAYKATLVLGASSSTYDREGTIIPAQDPVMPSPGEVERALQRFRGEIDQLPPMHSAVKVGGKRLYELARRGVEVERQTRRVTIARLDLKAYDPPLLEISVECSKGTYIRSLAHDLGAALGTGAYLDALGRTRHGPFSLEAAITLENLQTAFEQGAWQESLYPPQYMLAGWPVYTTTAGQERDIIHGKPLHLPAPAPDEQGMLAAMRPGGELLAVLCWDQAKGLWQPKKVML